MRVHGPTGGASGGPGGGWNNESQNGQKKSQTITV